MKLPLAYYGNPILRKKCKPVAIVDEEILQLVRDMEETLVAHDGCGIAAPQVFKDLALFLIKDVHQNEAKEWVYDPTRVYINPKILGYTEEVWTCKESCLSLPKMSGAVTRPVAIKIEATDLNGNRFVEELTGLHARIFLHENDHINGVLYIDRVKGEEREGLEPRLRKIKQEYSKE